MVTTASRYAPDSEPVLAASAMYDSALRYDSPIRSAPRDRFSETTRAAISSPPVASTVIAPVATTAARLYWVESCLSGVSCEEWYQLSGQVMNITAGIPCCM